MSALSTAILADAPLVYYKPALIGAAYTPSIGSRGGGLTVASATQLAAYTSHSPDTGSIVASTQYQSVVGGALPKPYSLECVVWSTHRQNAALIGDFLTANPDSSTSSLWGFAWLGNDQWENIQPTSGSQILATRTSFTWTHLVSTVDGTTMSFYVNGSLAGAVTDHTVLNSTGTQIITNVSGLNTGIFVADIALYGVALSASRVAAHNTAIGAGGYPQPSTGVLQPCA